MKKVITEAGVHSLMTDKIDQNKVLELKNKQTEINNTITKMRNTLEGINNRITEAEMHLEMKHS